jgi:polyisoprenoid-binding protein YceI
VKQTGTAAGLRRCGPSHGVIAAAVIALSITTLLPITGPSPALAAPVAFEIDPVHSEVAFKVRHLVSKAGGRFNSFEGTLFYDEEDPTASSVNVTIDVTSIDTNNSDRDGHLKSPDFFDVEKFPTLTFVSKEVKVEEENLLIGGELTMHGVTKPVTLTAEKLGMNSMGEKSFIGFSASAEINRKDFGIEWNKVLDKGGAVLGENVEIAIAIEAVHETPKTEAASESGGW